MKNGEIIKLNEVLAKVVIPQNMEVDEVALRNNDPKAVKWFETFVEMRNKLMMEEYKGEELKPCLSKDSFAKMAAGLQTFEAMLIMKYLLIKDV